MRSNNLINGLLFFLAMSLTFACKNEAPQEETNDTDEVNIEETEKDDKATRQVLYVIHEVADYASWKIGFDEHEPARLENGLHTIGVARNSENANEIHLSFFIDDIEKAKTFAQSEDLKAKMEELGVQGPPTMHYLNEVFIVSDPIESTERLIVMHDVEDYEKWRPVFDADEERRLANGLHIRGLLQNTENPNSLLIVGAYDDVEVAKAMIGSEEMIEKMAESGVIGEPSVSFINWEELNIE